MGDAVGVCVGSSETDGVISGVSAGSGEAVGLSIGSGDTAGEAVYSGGTVSVIKALAAFTAVFGETSGDTVNAFSVLTYSCALYIRFTASERVIFSPIRESILSSRQSSIAVEIYSCGYSSYPSARPEAIAVIFIACSYVTLSSGLKVLSPNPLTIPRAAAV